MKPFTITISKKKAKSQNLFKIMIFHRKNSSCSYLTQEIDAKVPSATELPSFLTPVHGRSAFCDVTEAAEAPLVLPPGQGDPLLPPPTTTTHMSGVVGSPLMAVLFLSPSKHVEDKPMLATFPGNVPTRPFWSGA